eukprot:TRINITY_DN2957_c3_g1_i1.p1 TRINITY_DN2957_c3_g1~~TRINITY_DN2957_c3_g1_i1.p1  ORF type:complete len:512 (+),score=105.57 TRINITY_DN2957_c3_g1_i1:104-1639(+)
MAVARITNVPTPNMKLPKVGHVWHFIKNAGCVSKTMSELQKKYGDTFQLDVPNGTFVATRDPKLMRKVYLQKQRPVAQGMDLASKMNRWPEDIVNARGQRHAAYRKAISSIQLRDKKTYQGIIDEKAAILVEAIKNDLGPDGRLKTRTLAEHINCFVFECVLKMFIGDDEPIMVTGRDRKGSGRISSDDAIKLSLLVGGMFEKLHWMENSPLIGILGTGCKKYQDYETCWKEIQQLTDKLVDPYIDAYISDRTIKNPEALVLPSLLKQIYAENIEERIDVDEARWVLRFAYVAATDTTTQTFEYLLYHIGSSPSELRDSIRKDIKDHPDSDSPLVSACMKESMRLIPTIPILTRELGQDMTFKTSTGTEMKFPAGTKFLLDNGGACLDGNNFENPTEFSPKRYLKRRKERAVAKEKEKEESVAAAAAGCPFHQKKLAGGHDSFVADVRFGHGLRRCPGYGFAQVMVTRTVSKLMQEFDITYDGDKVNIFNRVVNRPEEPLTPRLIFTPLKA